jgi:GT2 family glycosyltransferase
MLKTSVVIPNWNGRHLLPECLDALQLQQFQDFRMVVVDNGSTDGSVELLARSYPEVLVIANAHNRGFAAAVNQGIAAIETQYVALLNNDAIARPSWLRELVDVADTNPSVGMCASKMLMARAPGRIDSAGICVDRIGNAWDRLGGHVDDSDATEAVEVFGASGGAALYRRAMLTEVGVFDEDFFAYLEDVDLAWRARTQGWTCLYVPSAQVLHQHSATGVEGSPFKSFHLGRNKIWLLLKNYPVRHLWRYLPLVLAYDLLAVGYTLVIRRDVHALRGRLAGWLGARRMLSKRAPCRASSALDVAHLRPVSSPWATRRRLAYIEELYP